MCDTKINDIIKGHNKRDMMNDFVDSCVFFLQKEFSQRGFKKGVLGLSGGIDSAVVAALGTLALGNENLKVLLMPSLSSSSIHFDDALYLAKILNLTPQVIKLENFQSHFASHLGFENNLLKNDLDDKQKLRMGNFCSRLRMALLYDYASAENALVLGTSNKSELMLGYGTIFGDLACAINPIGSLYKTQIFALAKHLNLPQNLINKKPSADLFANQSDESDLGYSYEEIDSFLMCFENLGGLQARQKDEQDCIQNALESRGFESQMVKSLCTRIWANAFKCTMPSVFAFSNPFCITHQD